MTTDERWLIVLVAALVTTVLVASITVAISNVVSRRRAKKTHDRLNGLP